MTIQPSRRAILAGLAASTTLPAAISLPALAQDQSAGSIVIYTSNNQQSVQAVTDTAATLLPKVKISTITGGSGQLLRRIEAEAAKPQADIFWSSSPNTLGAFKALYEPYKSPNAASVPAELSDASSLWTAANIHVVTLMVNTNQLGGAPRPKTWADLLDPRWKGKIIIADPANSSTAFTILWGVSKLLGAEALKKLAGQVTVTSAAATVLRAVAQGELVLPDGRVLRRGQHLVDELGPLGGAAVGQVGQPAPDLWQLEGGRSAESPQAGLLGRHHVGVGDPLRALRHHPDGRAQAGGSRCAEQSPGADQDVPLHPGQGLRRRLGALGGVGCAGQHDP